VNNLNKLIFSSAQNEWSHYDKTCSGERQSPIDIETKLIKVNKSLSIKMVNYNMSILNFNVENNGHTGDYKIETQLK
jgi:carbonic anhydrase